MSWAAASDRMRKELKAKVVPALRSLGFRGSFPHFARHATTRIDLLSFQFSQWSPGLYVEIGSSPPSGITLASGTHVPPDKIRVHHLVRRFRLGSEPPQRDHLFTFDSDTEGPAVFERVAKEINVLLAKQAEVWWQGAGLPTQPRLPDN